jgi:hypothetical protein
LKITKDWNTAMFDQSISQGGHTRRFRIREADSLGWEVSEEQDSQIVRNIVYDDWHRVERARLVFRAEIALLEKSGWQVEPV